MGLERLRRLTRHEVRWRTATMIRSRAQHLSSRLRPPRWTRADVARILAPGVAAEELRAAVAASAHSAAPNASRHWQRVHDALAARLRSRDARFLLDPASRSRLREEILTREPRAAEQARARAERMLAGEYDILGYRGLRFDTGTPAPGFGIRTADDRAPSPGPRGPGIDWHLDPVHQRRSPAIFHTRVPYLSPEVGDHKIIWEINRHQHWLGLGRAAWLTGDPKFARAILDQLNGWLAANPPLIGINWASMLEVGFRSISWTWALHCLMGLPDPDLAAADWPWSSHRGPDPESASTATSWTEFPAVPNPWLVDMFVALARQLTHVEQNLSYYFSPNTHLTGEALALYVVGTALPELAGASRWASLGRRILVDEIDRQILLDGGHAERSTHYQRYTLDFYLLALLTSRIAGDQEAESRFAGAVRRLAEFTRVIADDRGQLPLLGDDDGGMLWPLTGRDCRDVRDSLSVAAVALDRPLLAPWGATEEALWLAGPGAATGIVETGGDAAEASLLSHALPETGYFVARDGRGGHAVFDAGAHGYMNGGHAHADALAFTLTLAGRPFLIDPGTSTYTMDPPRRDRLRSSMSHNTISIDGRSQSVPAGPFHWASRVDARFEDWRHNPAFDWVEGVHDGYAPLQHRRAIVRTAHAGWLIADEIRGGGRHTASAHWHFDPAWVLQEEPGRIRASHASGEAAWLLHEAHDDCRRGIPVDLRVELFHGDRDSGLGWCAPVYGTMTPAPAARLTASGEGPIQMFTWIGERHDWPSPSMLRVPVDCDAGNAAMAVQIADGDRCALFLLRPGGVPLHAARMCRVLDYETDARLLHYLVDDDRVIGMQLVDARRVVTYRQGWISIEAAEPFSDLHVAIGRHVIDIQASTTPPALRVRGIRASCPIRLNGHEWPRHSSSLADSLLIQPSDWRASAQPSPARLWRDSGAAFAQP
jgi:hypothetical protein